MLLCYGVIEAGKKIARYTGSGYSHAAICYSATEIVESDIGFVKKIPLSELIDKYSHIAVLRSPVAWAQVHVIAMNRFLDHVIISKCKYNFKCVRKFFKNKEQHQETLHRQLAEYFSGTLQPDDFFKESYFCSELVADCFAAAGFLDPGARIAFKSNTFAPRDLGKGPRFWSFVGYLSVRPAEAIPADDDFINESTFDEVFKSAIS